MSIWTEWMDMEKNPNYNGSGVYRIRLISSEEFSIKLSRFLGNDKDGILQIGHSENIQRRIRLFRRAMEGKKSPHAEGQRMYLIRKFTNLTEIHKDFRIQFSFKKLSNKIEAKREEEQLLKCYFKKFGEVPPINSNLPDKYIDWQNLICD